MELPKTKKTFSYFLLLLYAADDIIILFLGGIAGNKGDAEGDILRPPQRGIKGQALTVLLVDMS